MQIGDISRYLLASEAKEFKTSGLDGLVFSGFRALGFKVLSFWVWVQGFGVGRA